MAKCYDCAVAFDDLDKTCGPAILPVPLSVFRRVYDYVGLAHHMSVCMILCEKYKNTGFRASAQSLQTGKQSMPATTMTSTSMFEY